MPPNPSNRPIFLPPPQVDVALAVERTAVTIAVPAGSVSIHDSYLVHGTRSFDSSKCLPLALLSALCSLLACSPARLPACPPARLPACSLTFVLSALCFPACMRSPLSPSANVPPAYCCLAFDVLGKQAAGSINLAGGGQRVTTHKPLSRSESCCLLVPISCRLAGDRGWQTQNPTEKLLSVLSCVLPFALHRFGFQQTHTGLRRHDPIPQRNVRLL